MIRDIAVVMDGVGTAACPYASSLASRLGAFLLGACVPLDAETMAGAGWLTSRGMDQDLQEEMELRTATAERILKTEAGRWAVATGTRVIGAETLDAQASLMGLLRLHDLAIFEQPDPARRRPADGYLSPALLLSGRPCLMVPHGHAAPARLDTVMIAWDGSAAAARALADAMPLLSRASSVEAVHVSRNVAAPDRHAEADLVRHLAHHGIEALYHDFHSRKPDGQALLAHAADIGADIVVMGAYHHSPIRQAVLDGVTRTMMRSATMPMLMSH